jgi:hypothetical protein
MHYTEEQIAELNILIHYSLNTSNQGIKVHSTAAPEHIQLQPRNTSLPYNVCSTKALSLKKTVVT